jgi:hypothetical protein
MTPEQIDNALRHRGGNMTRSCFERVGRMSTTQLETLMTQRQAALNAQRNYDYQLRVSQQAASGEPVLRPRTAVPGSISTDPPEGPRPTLPACSQEAGHEVAQRRGEQRSMQMRIGVAAFYSVLGSAVGYIAGREVAGRGREGAAAGAAIAAIAGFIVAEGVRPSSGGW